MLSLFPEILFLAPLSALLFRLVLAYFLLLAAYKHYTRSHSFSMQLFAVIECCTAVLLLLGAYTQAGASAAIAITLCWLSLPLIRPLPRSTVFVLAVVSVSLLVTGAGAFAIDIPL